jgi:transcriptional regulator with XRE-family HTH domain
MQAKSVSDHALVAICMAEVCHRAGFLEQAGLVQRDLQFLSDSIESRTGVLISVSTIKRLLNGQFSRLPQIATLDALARFLDFPDWQQFKVAKAPLLTGPAAAHGGGEKIAASTRAGGEKTRAPGRRFVRLRVLLFISLLILATLGLFAVIRVGRPGLANIGKAQFSATKVTSNDLPNTVVFRYNIDSVTADSFFIQQSWDVHRKVRIYKQNYTLTDIYYEPGYHVAKLIANNRIIKTIDVSIPTDRWFFYSKDRKPRSQPKYLVAANGIKDGAMQLTRDDLAAAGIDFGEQNEYCQVYFPSRIEGSSDNFVLKCRIRMAVASHSACPLIMPEIFCQRYFMYFQTAPKGCTSELTAQFGDNLLNGKTQDLSSLGSDLSDWQNVEFAVRNDSVDIRINGSRLLSTVFHKSCGLITGLGFISNGLTAVDSVNLQTTNGKVLYHNDF